jgi:hypothetical protein
MDYHLELLLPVGTKTRQDNGEPSTIDLVFGTRLLSESIISCGLAGNNLDHDSDHLPITTLLSLTTTRHPERKRRLWNQLREKDGTSEKRYEGTFKATEDCTEARTSTNKSIILYRLSI